MRVRRRRLHIVGGVCRCDPTRSPAQLDYQATRVVRLANVLRIGLLFMGVISVVSVWLQRHRVKREWLPRKRRLEALLKELDAPEPWYSGHCEYHVQTPSLL